MSTPDGAPFVASAETASMTYETPDGFDPDAQHFAPPRWQRNLAVGVIVAAIGASWVGNAFAPALVAHHPLALIGMNPSNRYLLLASVRTDWAPYLVLGTVRRLAVVLAHFALGHWYGDRAIQWLEHRSPDDGQLLHTVERWFAKGAWPTIVVAPIGAIALLAGAARMRFASVVGVMTASLIVRLIVLRLVGHAFASPVNAFIDWVDRLRGPLLLVTIGSVVVMAMTEQRRRRRSLDELATLTDDDGDA